MTDQNETTMETVEELPTPESLEVLGDTLPEAPKRKKVLKKLTLNDLLDAGGWNPENFKQWTEWHNSETGTPYSGVRVYNVQMLNTGFVIRARKHSNGGYQILDFIQKNH